MGHEVMIWQAYLRGIAPKYDYITVCGPTGHMGMYDDFADKYITLNCDTTYANMWMNDEFEQWANKTFREMFAEYEGAKGADWITPRAVWSRCVGMDKAKLITSINPREFRKYEPSDEKYDILYHARYRTDWDSGFRNWPVHQCTDLLSRFLDMKVGCVGLLPSATRVSGTDDLRGLSLLDLTGLMANARVFVGPISGPCHLATLCGLPQATWATKAEHADRVNNTWNPFSTATKVITADDSVWKNRTPWTPETKEIEHNIRKLLNA